MSALCLLCTLILKGGALGHSSLSRGCSQEMKSQFHFHLKYSHTICIFTAVSLDNLYPAFHKGFAIVVFFWYLEMISEGTCNK